MPVNDAERIAERLRAGYDPEHPDFDIYADELVSWHNYDEREVAVTRDQLGAGAAAEHGALAQVLGDLRYEDKKVYPAGDVVVMTHVMVGTLPDGATLRIPACHVYGLEGGRIARMDVYMDSGQAAPIVAAFENLGVTLPVPE
jgi:ketosteroid isomerase-like protein